MQSSEHAIRRRFEQDFLPKYGSLWRCIEQTRESCVDFVTAIEKKTPVTIRGTSAINKQQCDCECESPNSENRRKNRTLGSTPHEKPNANEMQIIDLIEDSEKEVEVDTPAWVDSSNVVEILSDSDEDSIHSNRNRPSEGSKQRACPTSLSNIDDNSSDSSSDTEFEMDFSDHSDEETRFENLIESTKRLSVTGKENMRKCNQPTRERISMSKRAFKTRRESITKELFDEFNRKAFGGKLGSVTVQWSTKLRTTAGLTRLRRRGQNMTPGIPLQRFAAIELSKKVLDSQERLESTLLHEMVHAAAWIFDNQCKPPHGKYFWKWARIAMKAIPGIKVTTTHSYTIEYRYAWACSKPGCSFIVKRQSRSVDVKKHCCGRCKGVLVEVDAKTEKANRTEKKQSAPSGYNLFVKEQSKVVREKLIIMQQKEGQLNPKVSQTEVMKECARLWREKKAMQNNY